MGLEGVPLVASGDGERSDGVEGVTGAVGKGGGDTSVTGCDGVDGCAGVRFPDFFAFVDVSDADEEEVDGSFF